MKQGRNLWATFVASGFGLFFLMPIFGAIYTTGLTLKMRWELLATTLLVFFKIAL